MFLTINTGASQKCCGACSKARPQGLPEGVMSTIEEYDLFYLPFNWMPGSLGMIGNPYPIWEKQKKSFLPIFLL